MASTTSAQLLRATRQKGMLEISMSVVIELLIFKFFDLDQFRYAGYCPQYPFKCGETYARTTHRLLLDPTINHANTLILSNPATDDHEVSRPPKSDIDIVNGRFKRTDPIFVHPVLPGYEGFIPQTNVRIGQRYTVLATEGLAEFERQQLRDREALCQLRKIVNIQSGQSEPRNLEERLLIKSQFKLPLLTVRSECTGAMRNVPFGERCETRKSYS